MYDNCWEIENFSNCGEISVWLTGFYYNLCCFVAKSVIHAVLSQKFCHNLRDFMWRKIEPKNTFVEKKWQISSLLQLWQTLGQHHVLYSPWTGCAMRCEGGSSWPLLPSESFWNDPLHRKSLGIPTLWSLLKWVQSESTCCCWVWGVVTWGAIFYTKSAEITSWVPPYQVLIRDINEFKYIALLYISVLRMLI